MEFGILKDASIYMADGRMINIDQTSGRMKSPATAQTHRVNLDMGISFTVPLSIFSREPTFSTDTLTLRRMLISNGAQRWELEAGLSPINQVEILSLFTGAGYNRPIYIKMPQLPEIAKEGGENVVPSGVQVKADAGNNVVVITSDAMRILERGTFIRFGNHWKTYLITEKSEASSSIKITPVLLQNVPANAAIFHNDAVITLALSDIGSNVGISFDNGLVSNMTGKFVEYLKPEFTNSTVNVNSSEFFFTDLVLKKQGAGNVVTDLDYAQGTLTSFKELNAVDSNNLVEYTSERIATIWNNP